MILFRPVGLKELQLIAETGYREFPPRLDWQPIFYPVLNREYAVQIADGWNTKDKLSDYCGFVTRFDVEDEYANRYPVQRVGKRMHQELWVPGEELSEFNAHIAGVIAVVDAFYGERFAEEVDAATNLPLSVLQYSRVD